MTLPLPQQENPMETEIIIELIGKQHITIIELIGKHHTSMMIVNVAIQIIIIVTILACYFKICEKIKKLEK